MFENISKTLKITAKVLWVVGLVTIVGIIPLWTISFALYGLAEILEKLYEIEKNTRNGRSKSQIDEDIDNAEFESRRKKANNATIYYEQRAKSDKERIISEEKADEILNNLPEKVSDSFIESIKSAKSCYTVGDAKVYLNNASNNLENPEEIRVIKCVMELPYTKFQSTLNEICKRYDR